MKRVFNWLSVFTIGLVFLAATNFAYADLCPPASSGFASLCTLKLDDASSITAKVVTILLIVAFLASLIFIIIGGIRWITSGGDKGKVDAARGTITGAITGLVIALLAFFILNIITYLFTKQTFMNFVIPTIVP